MFGVWVRKTTGKLECSVESISYFVQTGFYTLIIDV